MYVSVDGQIMLSVILMKNHLDKSNVLRIISGNKYDEAEVSSHEHSLQSNGKHPAFNQSSYYYQHLLVTMTGRKEIIP